MMKWIIIILLFCSCDYNEPTAPVISEPCHEAILYIGWEPEWTDCPGMNPMAIWSLEPSAYHFLEGQCIFSRSTNRAGGNVWTERIEREPFAGTLVMFDTNPKCQTGFKAIKF